MGDHLGLPFLLGQGEQLVGRGRAEGAQPGQLVLVCLAARADKAGPAAADPMHAQWQLDQVTVALAGQPVLLGKDLQRKTAQVRGQGAKEHLQAGAHGCGLHRAVHREPEMVALAATHLGYAGEPGRGGQFVQAGVKEDRLPPNVGFFTGRGAPVAKRGHQVHVDHPGPHPAVLGEQVDAVGLPALQVFAQVFRLQGALHRYVPLFALVPVRPLTGKGLVPATEQGQVGPQILFVAAQPGKGLEKPVAVRLAGRIRPAVPDRPGPLCHRLGGQKTLRLGRHLHCLRIPAQGGEQFRSRPPALAALRPFMVQPGKGLQCLVE